MLALAIAGTIIAIFVFLVILALLFGNDLAESAWLAVGIMFVLAAIFWLFYGVFWLWTLVPA